MKTSILYFEKNSTENKEFKGKTSKFITGTLMYQPSCCENCGVKNENYTVYKNGTKTSRITLPIAGIYPTYLNLKNNVFSVRHATLALLLKHPVLKKIALFQITPKPKYLLNQLKHNL